MKLWKAKVRTSGGVMEITVHADTYFQAKAAIEAQHGAGSIFFGPVEA